MKIKDINRSWQALAMGLSKLIMVDGALGPRKIARKDLNKFSSWPRLCWQGLLRDGIQETRQVDVALLEQFLTEILPKEISYQDLLSSEPLDPSEHQPITDLAKLMAIKNLGDLVITTVKEMKMIEMNHIVSTKA